MYLGDDGRWKFDAPHGQMEHVDGRWRTVASVASPPVAETIPSDLTTSADDAAAAAASRAQRERETAAAAAQARQRGTTATGGVGSAQQVLRSAIQANADRAWQAEERRLRELGRVDDLFQDRAKFYDDVFSAVHSAGKAHLDEALRARARQDRFSLATRSLLGGSADVESERRRGQDYDDALTNVKSLARGRQQAAKAHDSALKSSLKQGVLQGSGLPSAEATRPRLASATDFGSLDEKALGGLVGSLGDTLMSGRTYTSRATGPAALVR